MTKSGICRGEKACILIQVPVVLNGLDRESQTQTLPVGHYTLVLVLECYCKYHGDSNVIEYLTIMLQVMLAGSGAIITKRYTEYAVGGLLAVVIIQGFGYGLIFDLNFFLRNLSVIGGLVMVFSETMVTRKKLFAGLPSISENDRKK